MQNVYEKLNYFLQYALFWLGRRGTMQLPQGVTMVGDRLTSFDYRVYTTVIHLLYKVHCRILTISQIATAMGATSKGQRARISKSLYKLTSTVFRFGGALVEGEIIETPLLLVKRNGSGRSLTLEITIPSDLWRIQQQGLYQVLDYPYFQDIPTTMAKRIWEFLEKRRNLHKSGKFEIGEQKLCSYVPITAKRKSQRIKTLKKHLDVLVDIGYISYAIEADKVQVEYLHEKKAKKLQPVGKAVDCVSMSSPLAATKVLPKRREQTSTAATDDSFNPACLYDSWEDAEVQEESVNMQSEMDSLRVALENTPVRVIENEHMNQITNPNPLQTVQLANMDVVPEKPKTSKDAGQEKADIAKEQTDTINKLMELSKEKTENIKAILAKALVAQGQYRRSFQELRAAIVHTNKSQCDNYYGFLRKCILDKWYESTLKSLDAKDSKESYMEERYEQLQEEKKTREATEDLQREFLADCKQLPKELRENLKREIVKGSRVTVYEKQEYCHRLVHHFAGKYSLEVVKFVGFMGEVWAIDEPKAVEPRANKVASGNSLGAILSGVFGGV